MRPDWRYLCSSLASLLYIWLARESWGCFCGDEKKWHPPKYVSFSIIVFGFVYSNSSIVVYGESTVLLLDTLHFCEAIHSSIKPWIYAERASILLRCRCIQCVHWWITKRKKHSKGRGNFSEDEERSMQTFYRHVYNDDQLIREGTPSPYRSYVNLQQLIHLNDFNFPLW